jgi:glutaconate CoA-transferase subunit B
LKNSSLQTGRIDVGFLGAAQIDRFANINTTVVGPYGSPKVRLSGAGGVPEIAASAKEVMVVMPQTPRSFVEELVFRTSVGYLDDGDSREQLGYISEGPTVIITDLGILRPDPETKQITLAKLNPGTSVEQVREATGWDLCEADDPGTTNPPTEEELQMFGDLHERTQAAKKEMQVLDDLVPKSRTAKK